PLKVVLGQPDRVEAQLLRLLDLLQLGAEDVLVAPAGRLLKEVERAEFHRGVRCQVMGVSWRSWWRQYSGEPRGGSTGASHTGPALTRDPRSDPSPVREGLEVGGCAETCPHPGPEVRPSPVRGRGLKGGCGAQGRGPGGRMRRLARTRRRGRRGAGPWRAWARPRLGTIRSSRDHWRQVRNAGKKGKGRLSR